MTNQTLVETKGAEQVPFTRADGQMHPTPTEIHIAILDAIIEDANNPETPIIPVHVGGLIRKAVTAACEGKYQ